MVDGAGGASVSELYGVFVQLNILFKALPPKALKIVNVYTCR